MPRCSLCAIRLGSDRSRCSLCAIRIGSDRSRTPLALIALGALLVSAAAAAASAAAPPASASASSGEIAHALALELHSAARLGDAATIARLLSSTAPGGAPSPDAPVGSPPRTPLIAALEGRHAAFDKKWPRFSAEPHRAAFAALLDGGADAGLHCATLEAATYRNVEALRLLFARMNTSQARVCLREGDGAGRSIFHVAAETPAAGLARVLSRAGRLAPDAPGRAESLAAVADEVALSALPGFESGELRKAAVEAALGAPDLEVLAEAFARAHAPADVDPALFAREVERDKGGLSPLLVACQAGRPLVVRRMLRLRLADAAADASDAGEAEGGGAAAGDSRIAPPRGSTCAHLAAGRGYGDVLREVHAAQGVAALTVPDAAGRSACSRVAGPDAGRVFAPVARLLNELGACSEAEAALVARQLDAPAERRRTAGMRLRNFNAHAHAAAGWRRLDPARLARLGVAPDLFDIGPTGGAPVPPCNGSAVGGRAAEVVIVSLRDARALRRQQQQGRPFLVERAFDPERLLGRNGTARATFLQRFGALRVSAGELPYASTYGVPEEALNVSDFVSRYMGLSSATGEFGVGADGAPAASSSWPGGPFERGPGSELSRPPYVFDSEVIDRERRGAARGRDRDRGGGTAASESLFSPLFSWLPDSLGHFGHGARRSRLRQLALGGPLSGAMPHFHPAAVNVLLFGAKLWVVFLPDDASFGAGHAADYFERAHKPRVANACRDGADAARAPAFVSFVQEPGDLVFVPAFWGHATVNLADSFAVAIE